MRVRALTPVVALLVAGCGLISSDITKLTFDLPTEMYSFNTSMWGNLPAFTVPAVPCTQTSDCCSLPTVDCTTTPLDCEPYNGANACVAELPESTFTTINLAMQVPTLQSLPGRSLVDVSISSVSYTVSMNTLNVDIPTLNVYMAPQGVTDPTASGAVLFGTIPSITAGAMPNGMMALQPNAPQTFQTFTSNISTPFNFIVSTTVRIPPGTPTPMGGLTVSVTGTISAQL